MLSVDPSGHEKEFAELQEETCLTPSEWLDVLSLPEAERDEWIADKKALGALSWATEPNRFDQVMKILTIVGTLAGIGASVVGFGVAVKNL